MESVFVLVSVFIEILNGIGIGIGILILDFQVSVFVFVLKYFRCRYWYWYRYFNFSLKIPIPKMTSSKCIFFSNVQVLRQFYCIPRYVKQADLSHQSRPHTLKDTDSMDRILELVFVLVFIEISTGIGISIGI